MVDSLKVVSTNGVIQLGTLILYSGTKFIIDNILIWSSSIGCILIYFECVYCALQKYRDSFRKDKCDFLLNRVKYVGHDLKSNGNFPAESKYDMIKDWKLTTNGSGLHSFVGLVIFYHRNAPYLKVQTKPLRAQIKSYFCTAIPIMAWSPSLIELFSDVKKVTQTLQD